MAEYSTSGPSRPARTLSPPAPAFRLDTRTEATSSEGGYRVSVSQGHEDDTLPRYEDDQDGEGDLPLLTNVGSKDKREELGGEVVYQDDMSYTRRSEGDSGIVGTEPGHERHRHATLEMKKALWWKNVVITGIFVLLWYTFATLLSLYNKWMFSPEYYGFGYPLFVTCCHMVVQFSLAAVIRVIFAEKYRPKERPTRKEYVTKILPTAASTGGDIGLSNFSLKFITLSLYTMCKSSTLIFVLLFAFTFKLETYSVRLIAVITLISFGVFCMVFNTTAVSIPGIVMVFCASALGGLRWALTELVMHKKGMGLSNPFATIFWLAPLMAVTLAPVSMVFEGWFNIFGSEFFDGFQTVKTIGVIVFPGALAFAMVASEYFIIQRAGVVPLSIAGIFKEVSTISISAWVFGDQLTSLNIVGVAITIVGIATYSFHKYQKSISSTVELNEHGLPIPQSDTAPLMGSTSNRYVSAPQIDLDSNEPASRGSSGLPTTAMPLSQLDSERERAKGNDHSYPPSLARVEVGETDEERTTRLRDDFEGWDNRADNDDWSGSEEEEEIDQDEVLKHRDQRIGSGKSNRPWGGKRWRDWWDQEM